MTWTIHTGEALTVLDSLTVLADSLVTDPPAGIAFMQSAWDGDRGGRTQWVEWLAGILRAAWLRLKPGAHGLIWALPRTSHWTATAAEDAGFDVLDQIYHLFATGYPKSHNLSTAIDKHLGVERQKVRVPAAQIRNPKAINGGHGIDGGDRPYMREAQERGYHDMTSNEPVSDEAKLWHGWGTRLKPAAETWWLVRKPVDGTIAENVLAHGTGALNIGGCRIGTDTVGWGGANGFTGTHEASKHGGMGAGEARPVEGRWPSHVVLTHHEECGTRCHSECPVRDLDRLTNGLASRFFFCAKPSRDEKDAGLEDVDPVTFRRVNSGGLEHDPKWAPRQVRNHHETVKSVELMRYLIRLVTPPGGLVLDPFAGSGTTGVAALEESMSFIGIEIRDEHAANARKRIAHAARKPQQATLAI